MQVWPDEVDHRRARRRDLARQHLRDAAVGVGDDRACADELRRFRVEDVAALQGEHRGRLVPAAAKAQASTPSKPRIEVRIENSWR